MTRPTVHEHTDAFLRRAELGRRLRFALSMAHGGELSVDDLTASPIDVRARLSLPRHPLNRQGVGWVAPDGALVLASPEASSDQLQTLARLVQRRAPKQRGFRALVGCRLLRVAADGSVLERFEDDGLWSEFRPAPLPGSLRHAAHLLSRAAPGHSYWFWAAPAVQGGQGGHLALSDRDTDPGGERLARWASLLELSQHPGSSGILRISRDNRLSFHTTLDPTLLAPLFSELAERPQFGAGMTRLATAAILRLAEGSAAEVRFTPGTSLAESDLTEVLGAEKLGTTWPLHFWYSSGLPGLVVDDDRDRFLERVRSLSVSAQTLGNTLSGRLSSTSAGPVVVTRSTDPGLVFQLAAFVREHRVRWPSLSTLDETTVVQRDAQQNEVARYRAPRKWS